MEDSNSNREFHGFGKLPIEIRFINMRNDLAQSADCERCLKVSEKDSTGLGACEWGNRNGGFWFGQTDSHAFHDVLRWIYGDSKPRSTLLKHDKSVNSKSLVCFKFNCLSPEVRLACRESFRVHTKYYTSISRSFGAISEIPFHVNKDTLYFQTAAFPPKFLGFLDNILERLESPFGGIQDRENLAKVKHLAIKLDNLCYNYGKFREESIIDLLTTFSSLQYENSPNELSKIYFIEPIETLLIYNRLTD